MLTGLKKRNLTKKLIDAKKRRHDLIEFNKRAKQGLEDVNLIIDGFSQELHDIEGDKNLDINEQMGMLYGDLGRWLDQEHLNGNLYMPVREKLLETRILHRVAKKLQLQQYRTTNGNFNETRLTMGLVNFGLYHWKELRVYTDEQVIEQLEKDSEVLKSDL